MARLLWIVPHQLGCCLPAIPIALELRRRGHELVALSTEAARDLFVGLGFGFRPDHLVPPYDWTCREGQPVPPKDHGEREWRWVAERVSSQVADVLELLDAEPYDFLLCDSMLVAGGLAAELRSVKWASYVHYLFEEHMFTNDERRTWWNRLRSLFGLPDESTPKGETVWYGLSRYLTLVLGLPRLSPPWFLPPSHAHRVGPTSWDPPFDGELPKRLSQLGVRRPAVLVSISTAWQEDADIVVRLAQGLRMEDLDIVATIVAKHNVGLLPDNVVVTGYVPHSLVLPNVQVVLGSAGHGLATKATIAGLPSVLVSSGRADHDLVARAVVHSGAGLAYDLDAITPKILRDATLRCLTDSRLRSAAKKLQHESMQYDAPTRSADLIEALLG